MELRLLYPEGDDDWPEYHRSHSADSEVPEAGSPNVPDVPGRLSSGKVTYTTIKNTIAAVAEELGKNGYNSHLNDERNKGAFVMGSEASDINTLLSRSETLAGSRKEGGK